MRGTVSRVELSPDGRKPARLYFKELPDGAFIACLSPLSFSNAEVNGFVGQRLEVRGRVAQSRCGASVADIQVMVPVMIYNLASGTPPDEAILPGMNVPPGAQAAVSVPAAAPAPTNPSIVPTDGVAIPVGTRLRVRSTRTWTCPGRARTTRSRDRSRRPSRCLATRFRKAPSSS